jgi:hypothetical protein
VLLESLTEVGFSEIDRNADARIFALDCSREIPGSSFVSVKQRGDGWPQLHLAHAAQDQAR